MLRFFLGVQMCRFLCLLQTLSVLLLALMRHLHSLLHVFYFAHFVHIHLVGWVAPFNKLLVVAPFVVGRVIIAYLLLLVLLFHCCMGTVDKAAFGGSAPVSAGWDSG